MKIPLTETNYPDFRVTNYLTREVVEYIATILKYRYGLYGDSGHAMRYSSS